MDTAKLFTNGSDQFVHLPQPYRFAGDEVFVKRTAEGVLLIPQENSIWEVWEKNIKKYKEPFMTERNQPQPKREDLKLKFD